ncbi:MAG: hypothetical protein M3371_02400, partial [Acidobacteriota bacterium]|nr:hypothetical protein [Acidobacteriota bacterium]
MIQIKDNSMRVSFFNQRLVARLLFLLLCFTTSATLNIKVAAQSPAPTSGQVAGDVPVLVKHLPEWETAQKRATFVESLP